MKIKIILAALALSLTAGCATTSAVIDHPCSQAAIKDLIATANKLKQCAAQTLIDTEIGEATSE